jgi:plastocyanin
MMKTYFYCCILALLMLSASVWAADKQIEIHDYAFVPADITVPIGTKITWINRDETPHTVAENDKQFRSPALDTDEQYTRTFDKPGTYQYYCTLHSQMRGKIIVTDK